MEDEVRLGSKRGMSYRRPNSRPTRRADEGGWVGMTEELTRLEEQLRRAFEGEAWHGPAVLEVLAGVSVEAAAAHPIPGSHSIWEIVLHLASTYRLVLRRIQG